MLAALLAAGPALALHQESPPAVKITTGGPHLMSPGRAWENLVVFSATEAMGVPELWRAVSPKPAAAAATSEEEE